MNSDRLKALWIVVLCGGLAVYGSLHLELANDISAFIPSVGEEESVEATRTALSSLLSDSELTRSYIFSVRDANRDQTRASALRLAERLRASERFAVVRTGPPDDVQSEVYDLYFPRRFHFLALGDAAREHAVSRAGLREAAIRLRTELAQPTSPAIREIATQDPLLLFPAQLDRLGGAQGEGAIDQPEAASAPEDAQEIQVVEGQFFAGDWALIFAATHASPFDGQESAETVAFVDAEVDSLRRDGRDSSPGREDSDARTEADALTVEISALHRYAVESEASIRADITRVSVVSSIVILLVFWLLFRSIRVLFLAFLPVALGMGASVFATAMLFERVHGLTLAFGASLIGVAVDYSVHLINHHGLSGADRQTALRRVWPGIAIGGLTTVAGLSGLAWTSFPGLREIAVFATVGVVVALVATRWVVVPLLPVARKAPLQAVCADGLAATLIWMRRRRALVALVLVPAALAGAAGMARLEWADGLAALNQVDPDIAAEDERVRARMSRMDTGRMVVARGRTLDDALVVNDEVYRALQAAAEAQEVDGFRSVASFLWSERTQRDNVEALRDPEFIARFTAVFSDVGFRPEAFDSLSEEVRQDVAPLSLDDVEASSFGDVVRPMVVRRQDEVLVLSFLRGVHDSEALSRRFDSMDDAFYFDQAEFLEAAYGVYRERTLQYLGVGLLGVLFLVFMRYRSVRLTLAAFLPALLAAGVSLGVFGWLGIPANLMHLVSLLLVLSIGVDYGVFMVEHRETTFDLSGTLLSVLVACLTTLVSFGLLAMSDNPALRSLGLTVGIGVLSALILAPLALSMIRPSAKKAQ